MRRDVAEGVTAFTLEYSAKLNQSVQRVKDTCSSEEFERYRRIVGRIMGYMYIDIMRPIFFEYPDLEPESLRRRPGEKNAETEPPTANGEEATDATRNR